MHIMCVYIYMHVMTVCISIAEGPSEGKAPSKPVKPVHLKDYERQRLLEKGR